MKIPGFEGFEFSMSVVDIPGNPPAERKPSKTAKKSKYDVFLKSADRNPGKAIKLVLGSYHDARFIQSGIMMRLLTLGISRSYNVRVHDNVLYLWWKGKCTKFSS